MAAREQELAPVPDGARGVGPAGVVVGLAGRAPWRPCRRPTASPGLALA